MQGDGRQMTTWWMAESDGGRWTIADRGPAVLKAPLEPNQQPNYTPSGTPNETGPEAARKQAEAARGSGRNPQAEAARKPICESAACMLSACMHAAKPASVEQL